jgi:hypothetical protein
VEVLSTFRPPARAGGWAVLRRPRQAAPAPGRCSQARHDGSRARITTNLVERGIELQSNERQFSLVDGSVQPGKCAIDERPSPGGAKQFMIRVFDV